MRKYLLISTFFCLTAAAQQAPMVLQYDQPATYFEESLPIGNGKLGALVYGGTDDNIIYLNDITLWTGKPPSSMKTMPSPIHYSCTYKVPTPSISNLWAPCISRT